MHTGIEVTGGVVRGETEGDLTVFRGIPYAAPPLRFAAPQPVQAWQGVREATRFGPPPPQSGVFGMDAMAEEGDDWLTVNVWSSDLSGRLPVMVWIQGVPTHSACLACPSTTAATSRTAAPSW